MIKFHASRRKVQRAKKHVADLNREILTFERRGPYRAVVDRESEPGYDLLRVIERIQPPEDLAILIGDAIHNLSSALDILACDIMREHRRGIASVHFPFAHNADDFEEVLKKRTLHRARENIVNEFRRLEPYPGGNQTLYNIHKLNISDKHKLLVPVFQTVGIHGLEIFRFDGSPFLQVGLGTTLMLREDGTPSQHQRIFFRVHSSNKMKYKFDSRVPFRVLLSAGQGQSMQVVPTLNKMVDIVNQIIATFEDHFNCPPPQILLGYSP